MQEIVSCDESESERNECGYCSEYGSSYLVLIKVLHIHLKTCEEHNEIDADLTKQLETCISCEQVQTILTNQHTSKNHSYEMWYMQFVQNQRSKQYDTQHKKENPCWVCYRKM